MSEWGGRKAARYRAWVLEEYGDICYLCKKTGADSVEHLVPKKKAPHLKWELSNMRPAHRRCNSRKGTMSLAEYYQRYPLPQAPEPEASRRW